MVGRRLAWLVNLITVLVLSGFCGVSTATADSEGHSGRVYEMVSPLYKGGYGANLIFGVAPDGDGVVFTSLGTFAGAPSSPSLNGYFSRRGELEWSTTSLIAPATILPASTLNQPLDVSSTLDWSLFGGYQGPNAGRAIHEHTESVFMLHRTDTPDLATYFNLAGPILKPVPGSGLGANYRGASQDLAHIVLFASGSEPLLTGIGSEPLSTMAAEAKESKEQVYDDADSGEDAPSVEPVGLNDKHEFIDKFCAVALGTPALGGSVNKHSEFNAIANSGREIFFATSTNVGQGPSCGTQTNPEEVFVRIDGHSTLELSAPQFGECSEDPCAAAVAQRAEFQGANEAGTCAFFTTSQPLVNGDKDAGNDLYVARVGHTGEAIGAPACSSSVNDQGAPEITSMVQVSHDPHAGEAAEVQGVVAVNPDGSSVFFVARGVLSDAPDAQGQSAVAGADNLYMFDTDTGGPPRFVADLCSGAEMSGIARDFECPSDQGQSQLDANLWLSSTPEAQTADAGRFLLFGSYGQLTSDDADSTKDLYRYDAVTGALERVSVGEAGYDANGNNDAFDARMNEEQLNGSSSVLTARLSTRAISEDGTRVIFASAEPLSPGAINGLVNIYEWHKEEDWSEGVVSLISSGNSSELVEDAVITPGGGDVFFVTAQGLVRQDTDGKVDVYDARLGGGFPAPTAALQPCSGDACQGPLSTPVALLVPGSVSQAAGGNFAPPAPKRVVKKHVVKKHVVKKKRRKAGKNRKNNSAKKSDNGNRVGGAR